MLDHGYKYEFPDDNLPIIKVIGVGGGGSNAVNHMFRLGVKDVDFVVCNTDRQALANSPVPNKIQLGVELTKGLGAGTDPEIGRLAALENAEDIEHLLGKPTQMVFVTAGMGGGTGTGAAPVIARIAREMGLLTIAVVTAPFDFEGEEKLEQAKLGIEELKQHCDTVLVVLNDKLAEIYGELPLRQAFAKADDVLANAVKSIAEIITVRGDINVDFMDVKRVLNNAGQAVMGSAEAEGKDRAILAIENALNSPLLNDRDIMGAKRILLTMASSTEFETTMNEQRAITKYIQEKIGKAAKLFKHGAIIEDTLAAKLRVTIIAAGFDLPDRQDFPTGSAHLEMGNNYMEEPVYEPEPLLPPAKPANALLAKGPAPRPVDPLPVPIPQPQVQPEPYKPYPVTAGTVLEPVTPTGPVGPIVVFPANNHHAEPFGNVDVLDEEPEEDPKLDARLQRMIVEFAGVRSMDNLNLDTPAYARHKIILYEMPLLPEHEIIRSRLTD